jgi:hypothetical protein
MKVTDTVKVKTGRNNRHEGQIGTIVEVIENRYDDGSSAYMVAGLEKSAIPFMKDPVFEMNDEDIEVLSEETEEEKDGEVTETATVDDEQEFVAYLTIEHDKGIYSTERGARTFSVRKAGEEVDAAWKHELGRFQATAHTAFSIASEKFNQEKEDWMVDGRTPEKVEVTESDKKYEEIHPGWLETLKVLNDCGYTANGVTAYLESRQDHDPMDDDPNRHRE